MGVKDNIRKAVSSNLKNKKYTRWDSESQPTIYAIDNFLRKSGYRLIDILTQGNKYELIIEPLKKGYFHPEISHDTKDDHFYAKITEYGMMESSDIEDTIKSYENALGVLKYLENQDLKNIGKELSEYR